MKRIIIKSFLIVASLCIAWSSFATEPVKVDQAVKDLIQKFENVEGIECQTFVKGEGLELIKMMLRKEFGRKFMKGVNFIAIIDYGKASQADCDAFHKELDIFSSLLEEFKLNEEMEISDSQFIRAFAQRTDDGLSDFVIAAESGNEKFFMYMGGKIILEE